MLPHPTKKLTKMWDPSTKSGLKIFSRILHLVCLPFHLSLSEWSYLYALVFSILSFVSVSVLG